MPPVWPAQRAATFAGARLGVAGAVVLTALTAATAMASIPRGLEGPAPQGIVPFNINDRGQVVGLAAIADATPSPQPTSTPPRDGMSGS